MGGRILRDSILDRRLGEGGKSGSGHGKEMEWTDAADCVVPHCELGAHKPGLTDQTVIQAFTQ